MAPPPAAPPAVAPPAPDATLQPLDFLLERMRDPAEDMRTRLQCAQLAAPFVHSKPMPGGKKQATAEAARQKVNKFAPAAPPKLVVNNRG